MSPSSNAFLVGLIGTGIGPSLTPPLHEQEADELGVRYLYRRLDLDTLELPPTAVGDVLAAARLAGYDGLNVTHPCKQLVLAHLDELSPDAEALVPAPSRSFLVGLVGSGIGPSLTPPMHEQEADELGIRYLYRRLDLDVLGLAPEAVGELLAEDPAPRLRRLHDLVDGMLEHPRARARRLHGA